VKLNAFEVNKNYDHQKPNILLIKSPIISNQVAQIENNLIQKYLATEGHLT